MIIPNANNYQREVFLQKVKVFHAHTGRRRAFLSASDAAAYDEGYAAFPGGPIPEIGTPAGMGFFDAEDRALDMVDD